MFFTHIVCLECGVQHEAALFPPDCSACGSPWLEARYDYAAVARRWARLDALAGRDPSLWRYAELLPIEQPDPSITLREGYSPLVHLLQYERAFGHVGLYVKDERQSPTGSFKDRQAALVVMALARSGVRECVLASTGNAAAAYAAYCARAGIKLWLFVTSLVPSDKMREAVLYGAEVVKVSSTYDETKHIAAAFAARRGLYFDRGARGIPGKESMKTMAFEMAEQLGLAFDPAAQRWRAPDWYIQAVSGGIGPLGVWKGFTELFQMGLIDHLPKMGIVQVAGCAPMVAAFQANRATADAVIPQTLITVLATGDPGYSYVQLDAAARRGGGTMISVEDGEAFNAMRRLARDAGLSVEPAAAVAFAGLEKMLTDGTIAPGETVVVNCSGHTSPAESHILGDQYAINLEMGTTGRTLHDGLGAVLQQLDEQVTTVLVVDDTANDRRLIRRMLSASKKYRILEAENGQAGLTAAIEHHPDLIVTDLTMPVMDGFTLLEQLKANPHTLAIPVVVVSAKNLTDADRALLEARSESVWTKGDYSNRQLVDHIVDALGDQPVRTNSDPKQ
ncbi:MAG: pyridoxal-phosphate dependent enzyme [Chloroflexota bacterium]|nr:pyridoxal-phosphate dependent enzyme [Chloroflexota bacterium]